ncbi:hypothetical protein SAMN06297144_1637 [Sphingomonas guangdongensis]|uniref:Uncharacterized protein n=1 Tax=Sphingomonas guangdongensis TaxID=1141890 RepID=A0A285QXG0_9SPHN|nr:hypothetical protein [Sphingomonas guangdongensis]SOB86531.1 hypothetical protein SAMN06297144_1637 [Sphingomonas guangdongensis]
MSRGPDATTLLERALLASAVAHGLTPVIGEVATTRWASATFTGMRHEIALTLRADPAAEAWLAALPESEFRLRGHLLADLIVVAHERVAGIASVRLEALTVEDR